jgi:predicted PurR-regulated permease PerM
MKIDSSVVGRLLIIFLVIAGLYFAKSFLMPLSIAVVLATLFLPLCNKLDKVMPRGISILICLLLLLAVMTGIAALLGWQISVLAKNADFIVLRLTEAIGAVREFLASHVGISIEQQSQIMSEQGPVITGYLQGAMGSVMSLGIHIMLILAYVMFLLYYREHIKKFLTRLFPSKQRSEMEKVVSSVTHVSQQYLVGLCKMIFCLWIMYGIGFSIIGVPNAIFFAILCGLLEIIPYIGNLTGTLVTLFVAAAQGAGVPSLIAIAGTYAIVQFIQGWALEPLILGPQVKINPLFTVLALVVGELIWGIPGVFLAIPLIAMFKIVCDHIDALKPYGFLFGDAGEQKVK